MVTKEINGLNNPIFTNELILLNYFRYPWNYFIRIIDKYISFNQPR